MVYMKTVLFSSTVFFIIFIKIVNNFTRRVIKLDNKGYILISNYEWCLFLSKNITNGFVNYWKRSRRQNCYHKNGDRIYLLNKKHRLKKNREIVGFAYFERFDLMTVNEAWIKYKKNNGYNNIDSMISSLSNGSDKFDRSSEIGCIILKDVMFLENPISLERANIRFEKYIQTGRTISSKEEIRLCELINKYNYVIGEEDLSIDSDLEYLINEEGAEKEAKVIVRLNQAKFRQGLLKKYKKCVLCGIDNINVLRASHSKSWKESDAKEKLDLNNGLLLCANHDLLYDRHLISFDDDKNIIVSKLINRKNKELLGINKRIKINISDKAMDYIRYHRETFYREEKLRN